MLKKHKFDFLIIGIVIAFCIILTFIISICKEEGKYAIVTIDDEVYEEYSLDEDIEVHLPTDNTLVIKDKYVYISESTCKDKVCINHGKINSVGETIICLPHKLVIEIGGDR